MFSEGFSGAAQGLIADEAAHTFVFSSASKTLEIHSTYASPAVSGSSDAHEPWSVLRIIFFHVYEHLNPIEEQQ